MLQKLHKNAKTNYSIRKEIKEAGDVNGKIKSKVFKRHILTDRCDLEKKLIEYLNNYNFEVRLKQIDYLTPADFLKNKFNKSIQPIVC